MAQDSWPSPGHNNRQITDVEYEQLAARFSDNGVYGSPSDDPVVTAGVGLTVRIRADVYASVRGHGWTSGPTGDTLDIAPNTSGKSRTDRVVLRLSRSTWTVRAVVKQGVPGEGPPTLTTGEGYNTFEVLLATVTVLNGANSVTVARGERYVGSRIRPTTSTAPDPNPQITDTTWETDTKRLRLYDGERKRTIYEDSDPVLANSPLSAWKALSDSVLERRNGVAHLRLGSFERTGGTLSSSTDSRLPVLVPVAYRHPTRDQPILAYISGGALARLTLYAANTDKPGQLWLVNYGDQITKGQTLLPQGGISWVVGD